MKQKPILKISKNILLEESHRQKAEKKKDLEQIFLDRKSDFIQTNVDSLSTVKTKEFY